MEDNKVLENEFFVVMLSKAKSGTAASTSACESTQVAVTAVSPSLPAQTSVAPATLVINASAGVTHEEAASNLVAGINLESKAQEILDIGGGSWDFDTVVHALRAASNNVERALEYLSSGIPEATGLAPPAPCLSPEIPAETSSTAPTVPTQAAVSVAEANAAPLDHFPQGMPALDAGGGGDAEALDFLRSNPQVPPTNDEDSSDASGDASASVGTGDAASTNGVHEGFAEGGSMYYVGGMNGYSPHGYVYDYLHGGYEPSVAGEWDDFSRYVVDGMEVPSPGVYSDNGGSVFLHATGYGYASNPSYNPYSPGTPVPTIGADGQLYVPQAFPYSNQLYQQPVSPAAPYHMGSPSTIGEGTVSGNGEPSPPGVDGKIAVSNGSPRPGFPAMALIPPHGPYSRGVLPLAIHSPGSQDVRYEGLRAAAPSWVDVSKIAEGQQRPGIPTGMHSMASQQLAAPGLPAQPLRPVTPLQLHIQSSHQSRNPSGLGSFNLGPGGLARGYHPLSGVVNGPHGSVRARHMGSASMDTRANGRGGWIGIDKGKQRGRSGGPITISNGALDPLNEQNRGPRTIRTRNQRAIAGVMRHTRGQSVNSSGNSDPLMAFANREQYNNPDFSTSYENAKFFVIKSYSEDDVHKSIKYNVWASTPVGNKRLDAAYQEALTKCNGDTKSYPVFLFFSVNASGQFCGMAQMTGRVDFSKSVDYWQQDKWNGRFPVTWHIIKDIPNCQFRHIILENNDNKPVTNSRDTQEVKFEQGMAMLNIFKIFASKTSILDDFEFYENRQRALTEKRARQHAQQQREQHRQGGGRTGFNEFESAPTQPNHDQIAERVAVEKPREFIAAQPVQGSHSLTPHTSGSDDSDENLSQINFSFDKLTTGVADINISHKGLRSPTKQTEQAGSGTELVGGPNDLLSEQKVSMAMGGEVS